MNSMQKRREFLKNATAAAVASGLPTLDTLTGIAHAAASVGTTEIASDYKAIVCVFLYGGQDHANVLIPYQDGNAAGNGAAGTFAEYTRYALARSNNNQAQNQASGNLSYTRAQLAATTISPTTSSSPTAGTGFTTNTHGRQFALHPNYSEIHYLYNQQKAAIVANTGPLTGALNRDDWYTDRYANGLPANLYSHDDQQKAWMSSQPDVLNPTVGVGGRIANAVVSLNGANPQISISISVSGSSPFLQTDTTSAIAYQVGAGYVGRRDLDGNNGNQPYCNTDSNYVNTSTQPYCLEGGPIRLFSGAAGWDARMLTAVRDRYSATPNLGNIYANQWSSIMHQSINTEQAVNAALLQNPLNEDTVRPFEKYRPSSVGGSFTGSGATINIVEPAGGTPFGGYNGLAAQLRMVATLIRAGTAFGNMKRQVFFVSIGGFDSHGPEFWDSNPTLNKRIDRALDAFWQSLGQIKVSNGSGGTIANASAQDRVTLFTMSEFGRTLDSNGQGSDHGWGGHHVVMGGAVRGGYIYGANHNVSAADIPNDLEIAAQKSRFMIADATAGAMPRMGIPPLWYDNAQGSTGPGGKTAGLNHSLDRGEFLPTMSSDAYLATIARWFGVPTSEFATVFPKLSVAHPTFTATTGVGFMS